MAPPNMRAVLFLKVEFMIEREHSFLIVDWQIAVTAGPVSATRF